MDTQTTLPARQPADGRLSSSDLSAFANVRQIIGDPHGMLMQDEVADRIQKLVNVLRKTVGLMDAFRMMDGLPGMSPEESLMARVAYRNINEMLDRVMPEWDAVCKAIHEANDVEARGK